MDAIEGIGRDLRPLLRREVGMFRARESRRVFDAAVNVGLPSGSRDSFVVRAQDIPAIDAALRVDVMLALLADSRPDWKTAWLSRSGGVEAHEADLDWLRAATSAFAIHGRKLDGFYVVTRTGWRDVRTDEQRTWQRLRL